MGYKFTFEVEDEDGGVSVYTAEYAVEPAQRGGMTDPSWDAYPYLDGDILDSDGNPVSSKEIEDAASEAMEADFRDRL